MATRALHGLWCAVPALLLLAGQHRLLYELLGGAPVTAVATATGLLNLAWYEVGYAVGGGLKSAPVFIVLPYAGVATNLLAGVAAFAAGGRFWGRAAAVQLAAGFGAGGLALAVLAWRAARGFQDPWRLAATVAFLAAHAAFAVAIRHARGAAREAAR